MSVVKKGSRKGCRPYTPEEEARIIELRSQGKTPYEIGVVVGRTSQAISNKLIDLMPDAKRRINTMQDSVSANASRILPQISKPTVLEMAANILQGDVRFTDDANLLKRNGRFVPATVTEIIRAANKVLLSHEMPQISNNPAWVVS